MSDLKVNHCECGCARLFHDGDQLIQIQDGTVDNLGVEWFNDTVYLKDCWERIHPKPKKCQTCNGTGRTKPKQPCDDCDGTGFVDPMRFVQCFHTLTYCKRGRCAIWDKDEHRCSIVSIAINTKRI